MLNTLPSSDVSSNELIIKDKGLQSQGPAHQTRL